MNSSSFVFQWTIMPWCHGIGGCLPRQTAFHIIFVYIQMLSKVQRRHTSDCFQHPHQTYAKCSSILVFCPFTQKHLYTMMLTKLTQIKAFWVSCGVRMMPLHHDWGLQPGQPHHMYSAAGAPIRLVQTLAFYVAPGVEMIHSTSWLRQTATSEEIACICIQYKK